jgi:CcmD family protein
LGWPDTPSPRLIFRADASSRPFREVDFPAAARHTDAVSSLAYLAAVNVVIWIGLFWYLWSLDRRISEKDGER